MADAGASAAVRTKDAVTVRDAATLTTTFTWTLQGLSPASFTQAKPDEKWFSPDFGACGVRWALQIEPKTISKGKDGAETTGVGLFLHLREPNCTFTLAAGSLCAAGSAERNFTPNRLFNTRQIKEVSSWGFLYTLTHVQLAQHGNLYLAPDGTLTVKAKLRAHTFASAPLAPPPPPCLQSELTALLESGEGADVSILVEGERLAAHSFVLALRSSTLKALLRGPLASAPPLVVNVPDDISPSTFKQLLRFIYADEAPAFESHEADYYGVPRLRSLSETALVTCLTPENAVTTLALAHSLSRTELRASVLRYVAENAAAVMMTSEWSSLRAEHPELLEAVLHTLAHHEPPVVIAAAASAKPMVASAPAPALTSSSRKRKGIEAGR